MNQDTQQFIRRRSLSPPHSSVQTRWSVITGGPGAGKSTVIEELRRRGHNVIPEFAREYLQQERFNGRAMEDLVADQLRFQRHIVRGLVQIEDELAHDTAVFLDRALPDAIAYYLAAGLDPQELSALFTIHRYERIFFLERLPINLIQEDNLRLEDSNKIVLLEEGIKSAYRSLGYETVIVPVMSVTDRVDYILKHM